MSGSGGSGGYEYQHNAIGYVAAHILATEPLGWLETGAPDIPLAVAAETDGPGDDLCITLQNNVLVELQAKHGLKKDKLFKPLLKLVKGLRENPNLYGVLLTDSTASQTIRGYLRNDLIKLGQGRFDSLKPITQEFQDQLSDKNLPKDSSDIFCRLRIIVLDLADDLQGAKIAQTLLSKLIADQSQSSVAWKILCDEGQKLTSNPGRRDQEAWYSLLNSHSISISDRRPSEGPEQKINWREICQALLEQWKGLTTNALTKPDGVRFQLDDVFVPLGVVERQNQPRHAYFEGAPERGSELYEEKVTPISHDDFFENVLRQRHSQYSQGRRIAIIGEPGAGKTTQLQKIGDWILKETDGIPIWIPLSAVSEKGLKNYLTQDWLETAIRELEVTKHHRDDLAQLLRTGKVWLLLDGADEMAVADALHHIATQMRGMWLQNVRVVLTCRLNVWEAGKNTLDNFDVYRNLDFEYPAEVHQFIDKWFWEEPALQKKLKIALEKPGKERIRNMVKNPLRLTLLCYSWQIRQGELPETKAGLYEWFVDAFYRWNTGKVPYKLTSAKRKELNQALGELAREAIDKDSSRFRLKKKFITHLLGDADDEDSLFHLALELDWLNYIGVAAEDPFEGVYCFFHPTFQEYFAALAISERDHFLPIEHIDQPVPGKRYRIFESNWEEVFLIWCGRNDIRKDVLCLIQDLINFNDKDFFVFRAYFLAANAEPELNNYELSDKIINQLLDWGFFVEFRPNRSCFWNDSPIRSKAKETLKLTSFGKTVNSIINQINLAENIHDKQDLAEFLGVIDPHNNQAVRVLTEIMNCTEHRMTQIDIAQSLWIADQGNLNAISRFLDCLESKDHVIQDHAAYVIRESKIYSYEIIEKLISVLQRNKQKLTFELREVLRAIEAVGRSDRYIIDSIIELIEIHRKEESFQDVYVLIWTLGEIGFKDSKSSKYFLDLLKKVDDVASRCYIADGLGKTDASDQGVIDTLIALTSQNEHEWTRQQAAASLLRIDPTNVGCLDLIINLLKTTESWRTQAKIVDSIEQTSFGNSIAINRLEDFLENCFNNYVKKKTAISLGKINPGNAKAISTLLQILRDSNNSPRANDDIVWNLGEIGKNNLEVVRMLIQLFERKYDSENDLINHLHERNLSFASRSLCKAATQPMYRTVVENLKRYLSDENFKSHFEQFKAAYESIWHCAENMNYQDFYQAWHSSPCVELPNN